MEEDNFLPNLASMLEVSLIEDTTEEPAENYDNVIQNETASAENDDNVPQNETPSAENYDNVLQNETALDCGIFSDFDGYPENESEITEEDQFQDNHNEFAEERSFESAILLDPKHQASAPLSEEENAMYTKHFKGKTKRNLEICTKEHLRNIENGEIEKSAIAAHSLLENHKIRRH
ncbi:hypothetical protein L9F63_018624 [Diploptera punctata]|uniref:Uncharacterized protein n=1 Tax=Diploptera punctata TaxID=6984 RepID=A0AAD7ZW86_DIPPU|nr:hypothetical protein L9F63_018624 [Diploptera punctata]